MSLLVETLRDVFSFADQVSLLAVVLVCKRWKLIVDSTTSLDALRKLRPHHLCVKPRGCEQVVWYRHINDAVNAAPEGAEIWVGKGHYQESLQLTKTIRLRNLGETKDVSIDVQATSFLDIKAGEPVFENLTLGSDNGREFSCILVSGGSPQFVGCDMQMLYLLGGSDSRVQRCKIQHLSIQNEGTSYISDNEFPGSRYAAICVTGANTYPTLTGNVIRGGELMAVLLENCKGARMTNNTILNVKQCGVEAVEVPQLCVTNNVIRDCGSYGIYVRQNSFALVTRNTVTKCKSAAVCFDHSTAYITENTISDVKSSAIHAYFCNKGDISSNRITQTGHSSVILDGCSNVQFSDNYVQTEEHLALLIIKGTDVVVSNNKINSMGSNVVVENASPHVVSNTISCGSIGVLIYGNSKPLVEDNEITNHEDAGVDILVGSSPVLRHNRIHHNGGSGVAISEVINFADRCDFPDKRREAIVDSGMPLLIANEIHNNTLMAINSKGFFYTEMGNDCKHNKNYVPEDIISAVKKERCTFTATKEDYVPQYWHPSVDDRNVGICQTCYKKGHFEVMGKKRQFLKTAVLSRFYCDCDCSSVEPKCCSEGTPAEESVDAPPTSSDSPTPFQSIAETSDYNPYVNAYEVQHPGLYTSLASSSPQESVSSSSSSAIHHFGMSYAPVMHPSIMSGSSSAAASVGSSSSIAGMIGSAGSPLTPPLSMPPSHLPVLHPPTALPHAHPGVLASGLSSHHLSGVSMSGAAAATAPASAHHAMHHHSGAHHAHHVHPAHHHGHHGTHVGMSHGGHHVSMGGWGEQMMCLLDGSVMVGASAPASASAFGVGGGAAFKPTTYSVAGHGHGGFAFVVDKSADEASCYQQGGERESAFGLPTSFGGSSSEQIPMPTTAPMTDSSAFLPPAALLAPQAAGESAQGPSPIPHTHIHPQLMDLDGELGSNFALYDSYLHGESPSASRMETLAGLSAGFSE